MSNLWSGVVYGLFSNGKVGERVGNMPWLVLDYWTRLGNMPWLVSDYWTRLIGEGECVEASKIWVKSDGYWDSITYKEDSWGNSHVKVPVEVSGTWTLGL